MTSLHYKSKPKFLQVPIYIDSTYNAISALPSKIIGLEMPCVVRQLQFSKTEANKLLEKIVKNCSQSMNTIHQTKQVSQTQCRSNYLKGRVVKFHEKGVEMLMFMLC